MSERATIHQSQQVGVETTTGVAVPANRRFSSVAVNVNPSIEGEAFKPAGSKHATKTVLDKEQANVSVEGVPAYDEIAYLLAMVYGNHTVEDNGDGTYTHRFSSRSRGADELLSLTVEQGDAATRAHRSAGVSLADLTFEWNRGGNTRSVSGSGFGKAIEDDIRMTGNAAYRVAITGDPTTGTFTLTVAGEGTTDTIPLSADDIDIEAALAAVVGDGNVTAVGDLAAGVVVEFAGDLAQTDVTLTATDTFDDGEAVAEALAAGVEVAELDGPVIAAGHITVYADEDAEDIGTTPLGRVMALTLAHTGRQAPVWTLNRAHGSYATQVETDPTLEASITVAADAEGMALLEAARRQAKRYIRIEAVGPTIEGTDVAHSVTVDLVARVSTVGEFSDEQGVYAIPFTLAPVAGDPDMPSNELTVINGLEAL